MLKKVLHNPIKAIRRLFSIIFMYFRLRRCKVLYAKFPYIDGIIIINKSSKAKIIFDGKVNLNSGRYCNPVGFENKMMITAGKSSTIKIGNNTGMSNVVLYAQKGINIGENVLLGNGVKIYDTDFHSLQIEKRINYKEDDDIVSKEVNIMDGAFIGAGTVILKGVTIGANSIIGACSVVSKDIPSNEVWGGNPIKFIRKI